MYSAVFQINSQGWMWLALSICSLLAGCHTKASTPVPLSARGYQKTELNLVDTTIAVSASISASFVCTGKIRCADQQQISSLVGGKILELNLVPGAYLKAGRAVVSLDARFAEIELEEAKLALRLAEEKFEELKAARPEGDSLSPTVLSRWELTAGIPAARLQLKKAELNIEATSITISESGWVGEVKAKSGQQIFSGAHLADFFPDRALEAELYLVERPQGLKPGASVIIQLPGQTQTLTGKLHAFLPTVNEEGFVVAYVSLPAQSSRLLPGQAITARIENLTGPALPMVPAGAILHRGGRDMLFTYHQGLAEWTYVETGTRHGDMIQIREGIAAGDTVLTAGHQQLGHGAAVKIAARNRDQP